MIWEDPPIPVPWAPEHTAYNAGLRAAGKDWPSSAHSMIGLVRLANIRECMERVLADGIPGDLAECGAWRGGACIYMRAVLKAHAVTDRTVWVADSFAGLPRPIDGGGPLAVSEAQVRHNFEAYALLDDQVKFLPGWFSDTLPGPVQKLAVLRLDADQYLSQFGALDALYPKLSPGGCVIIDDYPGIPECKAAVDDYRLRENITEPMTDVGGMGVFWRK